VHPPEGYAEFVVARSPALLRTAWLLTGDRGLAEDLVQDALARAWRAWPTITRTDRPEVYVRQVMVNTSITWARRRWRGERPTARLPEFPATRDDAADVDARDEVRRALAALPARQRATVVLRFVEDLSEVQTAQVLGCSVGTVKSQTARALARLRELLPAEQPVGGRS
jgi:RNA polymerase sigma-70 factor (sigma-E family)